MALETVEHIDDLDVNNPAGTDPKSQGDDHIRNIKSAIKTTFPNITDAVTATHDDINKLDGLYTTTEQLDYLGGYCKVAGSKTDNTQIECETTAGGTPLGTWHPAVTSQIQTQFDTRAPIIDPEFAGTVNVGYCATSGGTLLGNLKTSTDCIAADATNVWTTNTVVQTGVVHDFAAAQYSGSVVVDTAVNQATEQADLSLSNVFIVNVNNDSDALHPINHSSGGCYTFLIKNTGAFDLNFTSDFNFPGGEPTLTSGTGKVDLVSCVSDGTKLYCSITYDLTASN
jgi:hypothetical protein